MVKVVKVRVRVRLKMNGVPTRESTTPSKLGMASCYMIYGQGSSGAHLAPGRWGMASCCS